MCREILEAVAKLQKLLDCPKKIISKCHPRAHLEVFVDAKKGIVTLVCSKCDSTVGSPIRIKMKGKKDAALDRGPTP